MKLVIQRVKEASVTVDAKLTGRIAKGALIFLGVSKEDTEKDIDYLVGKVAQLRMFEDGEGKMNLSAQEAGGEFLVVSQFTLLGNCSKGRRPSFDQAAGPEMAKKFYELFVEKLRKLDFKVATGEFRAMMDVALVNDGPVTFVLESP